MYTGYTMLWSSLRRVCGHRSRDYLKNIYRNVSIFDMQIDIGEI